MLYLHVNLKERKDNYQPEKEIVPENEEINYILTCEPTIKPEKNMMMNEDRNDEQTRKKNFKLSYKNLFLTKRAEMKQGNKKNNIKLNIRSTSIKKNRYYETN